MHAFIHSDDDDDDDAASVDDARTRDGQRTGKSVFFRFDSRVFRLLHIGCIETWSS
jgi:hypothetical protein